MYDERAGGYRLKICEYNGIFVSDFWGKRGMTSRKELETARIEPMYFIRIRL